MRAIVVLLILVGVWGADTTARAEDSSKSCQRK